jgi:uncharacterized membrane protein YeaQ/YmgE (transglycosylase-associated protein family)
LYIAVGGAVGWVANIATGSRAESPFFLLGISGALVGTKIVDAIEFEVLGAGTFVGAALGAAVFVIGWRQTLAP